MQQPNRHQRRVAEALARRALKDGADAIVAVHESGHAVAMAVACGELGYPLNRAIDRIDIGAKASTPSFDGRAVLVSQGVTFGPAFSRDISSAAEEYIGACIAAHGSHKKSKPHMLPHTSQLEFYSRVIEIGRAAGHDIDRWFCARTFDAVSGPIAEAIFSQRSFDEVWRGYQAESDLCGVVRDATASGFGIEHINSTIDRMAALSACMMETPGAWAAVQELAKNLQEVREMEGTVALGIITSVLSDLQLNGMFAGAVERLNELETEINAAGIAIAITADKSQRLIKGKTLVEKTVKGNRLVGQAYDCRFKVFGETLWRAFGDGAGSK